MSSWDTQVHVEELITEWLDYEDTETCLVDLLSDD